MYVYLVVILAVIGGCTGKDSSPACPSGRIEPRTGACLTGQPSDTSSTNALLMQQMNAQRERMQELMNRNNHLEQSMRSIMDDPNATAEDKQRAKTFLEYMGTLVVEEALDREYPQKTIGSILDWAENKFGGPKSPEDGDNTSRLTNDQADK